MLLPTAFALAALPFVRIAEMLIGNLSFVPGGVLLGARRNSDLLWASMVSSALALALTAVLAVLLEAYSLALGLQVGQTSGLGRSRFIPPRDLLRRNESAACCT